MTILNIAMALAAAAAFGGATPHPASHATTSRTAALHGGLVARPGQEIERVGNDLFYLEGRGVLQVPAGWTYARNEPIGEFHFDNLVFTKTWTSTEGRYIVPHDDECVVSPDVSDSFVGAQSAIVPYVDLFMEDYTDDFKQKGKDLHLTQPQMRLWHAPYRGMTSARFTGSQYAPGLYKTAGGYFSTNVVGVARAGVNIFIRCTGDGLQPRDDVGADFLTAIDIDATRPLVYNWKDHGL